MTALRIMAVWWMASMLVSTAIGCGVWWSLRHRTDDPDGVEYGIAVAAAAERLMPAWLRVPLLLPAVLTFSAIGALMVAAAQHRRDIDPAPVSRRPVARMTIGEPPRPPDSEP